MNEFGEFLFKSGIFISAVMSVVNFFVQRGQNKTINLLEKNTNSIKDALVKVTGESEHAKGVIQGKADQVVADDNRKPR